MPKKNYFVSAEMSIADLDAYKEDEFNNFTFQQFIDDGEKNDDYYVLSAYAIDNDGNVMGDQIILKTIDSNSHLPGKRVQFANIVVTRDVLDQIFPGHIPTSPLTLVPQKSTNYPKYIAYKVQGGANLAGTIIDPSPPAKSP
jgi:hypothetical protein